MRRLADSPLIAALLAVLYILANQAALPVPTFSFSRDAGTQMAHSEYCACSGCSPDGCCCAALAPADGESDGGIALMGLNCKAKLSWFLIAAAPVIGSAAPALEPVGSLTGPIVAPRLMGPAARALGTPEPPPRTAA
jgi:hypothetical protein